MDERIFGTSNEIIGKMERSQKKLEGLGYDILNCSDEIVRRQKALREAFYEMQKISGEDGQKESQKELMRTVEEISKHMEYIEKAVNDMSVLAHKNERELDRQQETVRETISMIDFLDCLSEDK
ncbi:MAG: hypothetical protein K6G65_01515 [Lachnospiraceae bacterium]|nr:hypothetical protein [Lachnospiraceae bacterium]